MKPGTLCRYKPVSHYSKPRFIGDGQSITKPTVFIVLEERIMAGDHCVLQILLEDKIGLVNFYLDEIEVI